MHTKQPWPGQITARAGSLVRNHVLAMEGRLHERMRRGERTLCPHLDKDEPPAEPVFWGAWAEQQWSCNVCFTDRALQLTDEQNRTCDICGDVGQSKTASVHIMGSGTSFELHVLMGLCNACFTEDRNLAAAESRTN